MPPIVLTLAPRWPRFCVGSQVRRAAILKDTLKFVVGIFLAALLMWWVLRGSSAAELVESIGRASIVGLLAAGALNICQNVFRLIFTTH